MQRTFAWFNDPVGWVFESHQTALQHADRVAGFALPGVVVLEREFFAGHTYILVRESSAQSGAAHAPKDRRSFKGIDRPEVE